MDTGQDVTLSLWLVSSVLIQHSSSSSTHSVINRMQICLSVGSGVTTLITPVALMRGVAILGVVMGVQKCLLR